MTDDDMDIAFRILEENVPEVLAALESTGLEAPTPLRPSGALGGGDLVTLLVGAGAAAIPTIARLVIELDKNRRASVEADGIKVTGASRELVEEILRERLLAKKTKSGVKAGGR
jgi:hypothetical protein